MVMGKAIKVKEYGGTGQRTDSNGCVSLLLEGSNTTIYVNGFEAFDGSVSRLDNKEIFNKLGQHP
jgi:hypothetical protein